MSLNPQLCFPLQGPTNGSHSPKIPVPYIGECFFASRDTCHVTISSTPNESFSGIGTVYLTNYRLVFVPKKPNNAFRGYELPLLYIQDFDVHQPILGANYMRGTCRHVMSGDDGHMVGWKVKFCNGGLGTMVPLFYATVAYIRTASANRNQACEDTDSVQYTSSPPEFVANAVVDPNDPTVVYVIQPQVPEEESLGEPKFPTAKKND